MLGRDSLAGLFATNLSCGQKSRRVFLIEWLLLTKYILCRACTCVMDCLGCFREEGNPLFNKFGCFHPFCQVSLAEEVFKRMKVQLGGAEKPPVGLVYVLQGGPLPVRNGGKTTLNGLQQPVGALSAAMLGNSLPSQSLTVRP